MRSNGGLHRARPETAFCKQSPGARFFTLFSQGTDMHNTPSSILRQSFHVIEQAICALDLVDPLVLPMTHETEPEFDISCLKASPSQSAHTLLEAHDHLVHVDKKAIHQAFLEHQVWGKFLRQDSRGALTLKFHTTFISAQVGRSDPDHPYLQTKYLLWEDFCKVFENTPVLQDHNAIPFIALHDNSIWAKGKLPLDYMTYLQNYRRHFEDKSFWRILPQYAIFGAPIDGKAILLLGGRPCQEINMASQSQNDLHRLQKLFTENAHARLAVPIDFNPPSP